MEIHWRDTVTCPSEAEYLDMVGNRLSYEDPLTASEYIRLVNRIGVYYQVRTIINLKSAKCRISYIACGRYSVLLSDIGDVLWNINMGLDECILRQRARDQDVKKYAIEIIEAAGVFSDTETERLKMEQQTRAMRLVLVEIRF
ncbi:hypothetical protein BSLG_003796 [Batrachochytrium salamandrivorans]|nr:hypothetical protein BSLG_003796 [Batrachochytrium salamandrivorans]